MIKVWVILASLLAPNGDKDQIFGRHSPDWTTQEACEESISDELVFLKEHFPSDVKVTMVCVEQEVPAPKGSI